YILCSVMESPQMARRSPDFKYRPVVGGALAGLNFCSSGAICWPWTEEKRNSARAVLQTAEKRDMIIHQFFGPATDPSRSVFCFSGAAGSWSRPLLSFRAFFRTGNN